MHPLVQAFEKKQIESLSKEIQHAPFRAGDTLKITVQIEDKGRKWTQTCEGICISRVNKGIASNFVIRRMHTNGSVKMRFPLWLKGINIDVLKRGRVRRAKLYYLEKLSRKAGRIKELMPKRVTGA